jgi:hypothetical protein
MLYEIIEFGNQESINRGVREGETPRSVTADDDSSGWGRALLGYIGTAE